jgi:hypothetical protein
MPLLTQLPAGYEQAYPTDLFEGDNQVLKQGIPFLRKVNQAYRQGITSDMIIPYTFLSDVKSGVIFINREDLKI